MKRGSRSPTRDVARRLNLSRSTAARAIAEAREQGLLGLARRTAPGEL
jgi:DNA-binding transcriptional regulator LsrR (DeoR family)